MSYDLKYQDIVDRLNDMAEVVAAECIPGGRREGNYWRGDLQGKISVHISGARVGMVGAWQGQFGDKTGGNLIRLIELAFGCQSHSDAVRLAKERFLGISRRELAPEEKKRWARQQEESKRRADQRKQQEHREREEKVESVRSIWNSAIPIRGTPAEAYLRSRSIELSDFLEGTTWMPSLRYHAGMYLGKDKHAALIGGVQAADRSLIAIWRIFLMPDGRALTDAEGRKVKLGLGPAAGGAVRLGPTTETLRLTEGIETGLGVMLLTRPGASVWATLSTSGMIGFAIPPGVKRLEIYADCDRHRLNQRTGTVTDPPGIIAAIKLQERARSEGVDAVIYPSPEPDDWLDVWVQRKKDDQRQRTINYA